MTDRDWFVRTVLSAYSQYRIATKSDETERYEQLLQKLLPYSFIRTSTTYSMNKNGENSLNCICSKKQTSI